VSTPYVPPGPLRGQLLNVERLEEQARAGHEARVRDLLHRLVPEYRAEFTAPPSAAATGAG